MARRREISEDIKRKYKSAFINATQAGEYLGMCPATTRKFLSGLDVYKTGKEKKFFATDIAQRMEECRTIEIFGG